MDRTAPPQTVHVKVDAPASLILGGRVGNWFESAPWACVGGDVSGYSFDGTVLKANVFSASLFAGARLSLAPSAGAPHGRVQVYGLGGFSIVFSNVRASVNGMRGHAFRSPWTDTSSSATDLVAPYLAAGLAAHLSGM